MDRYHGTFALRSTSRFQHNCYTLQELQKVEAELRYGLKQYDVKLYKGWPPQKWWALACGAVLVASALSFYSEHWAIGSCIALAGFFPGREFLRATPEEPPYYLTSKLDELRPLDNDQLRELEHLVLRTPLVRPIVRTWVSERRPLLVRDLVAIRSFFERERKEVIRTQMLEELSKPS